MGVGLRLGVADLLGCRDRGMERRSSEIDLAEQASGAPEDRQRAADAEVVALRPTSIGDGGRRDRNGRRIALDRCGELGELGEPVRCDPWRSLVRRSTRRYDVRRHHRWVQPVRSSPVEATVADLSAAWTPRWGPLPLVAFVGLVVCSNAAALSGTLGRDQP